MKPCRGWGGIGWGKLLLLAAVSGGVLVKVGGVEPVDVKGGLHEWMKETMTSCKLFS